MGPTNKKGILYLVATPIGNLGDITFRAVEVLSSVSRIACEDTRRTRKLLSHLGISRPLLSVPSHDEPRRARALLEHLLAGHDVAFVSDAGMPGISDPGAVVVRAAVEESIRVVPVPGPTAVVSAIAISGLPSDRFSFLGFLPRKKKERSALLTQFGGLDAALVLHEAPSRIGVTLEELARELGGNRRAVLCRELTKLHEEIARGTLTELAERFKDGARGEITLVVAPPSSEEALHSMLPREEALEEVALRVSAGERLKDACKAVAARSRVDARTLYQDALKRG